MFEAFKRFGIIHGFKSNRLQEFCQEVDLVKKFSHYFKICAQSKSVLEGQALHCHIIKGLAKPQTTLFNSLANMYTKCGLIADAKKLFDEMPERDVVSWNTMINGYISCGYVWNAFICFKFMLDCGVLPDQFSLNGVVKGCAMDGDLSRGLQVHGLVIKFGLCHNAFVGNELIGLYGEFDCFEESVNVFDGLVCKDVAVINTMIGVHARMRNVQEAFENMRLIFSNSMRTDRATFVNLLGSINGHENLTKGLQVHGLIIKCGFEDHGIVENSLVGMYCSCVAMNEALNLLVCSNNENVMSWTTWISQCSIRGCFNEVMDVFWWMFHNKVMAIDEAMIKCILNASAVSQCLHFGIQIHSIVVKTGIESDRGVVTALMGMYANCSCLEDMHKIFQQVGSNKNLIFWTTIISGSIHNGLPKEALEKFSQMLSESVKPDAVACVSVLMGCVSVQTIEHGEMIHAHVTKSGNETNNSVRAALISLYANFGCFHSAKKLLLVEYDVVSVTALISGYVKFGYNREALLWFINMTREGPRPNSFTLATALTACSKSTAIVTGKLIHGIIVKIGFEDDKFIASGLIDMYSKCGAIEDAVQYFDRAQENDLVVWNSILAGHGHHGNGEEVLKVFNEMQVHGIKPDEITFLSVLHACSHGGLADQVMSYFFLMCDVYGISPMEEHYACVVDALGRAGLFKEAVKFIEAMNSIPFTSMLRSLLSCCILYGCSQLGLAVMAKIIVLGVDEVATYVLFSKLCANDEKWIDTLKVREVMDKKSWQPKKAGTSWIESKGYPLI